jgi:two-component system, NtrC family, sensor kinase
MAVVRNPLGRFWRKLLVLKHWEQHLTTRLLVYFLVLSLVSVAITGGVTFHRAQASLQRSAFDQLSVAATLKENEINRWFEDQQRIFLSMAHPSIVQSQSRVLLDTEASQSDRTTAHALLTKYLTSINVEQGNFSEISILDRSDHVIVSTDQAREGKYEPSADLTYFEEVKPGEPTTPIFYTAAASGQLIVTFATPLRKTNGDRIGVITTHLNLDRLSQIVKAQSSLGQAVDSYLVGSLGATNRLVSTTLSNLPVGQAVSSVGINTAMRGVSGSGVYQNYAQIPVMGVYQSLSMLGLSLLVEQRQDLANQPAKQLAQQITLLGLVSAGMLSLGLYWLARRITDPILKIAYTATQVAAGDLDQQAPVLTEDEVGLLARNFNGMVDQLKLSRDKAALYSRGLEQKAQELETALQELGATQAQLVQSEKMSSLGQLVAGVAHEINNPVSFIAGNLTYIKTYTHNLIHLVQLYQQHCVQPDAVIQATAEEIELNFLLDDLPKLLSSMEVGTDRIRDIVLSLRNFSRMDEADQKVVNIHEGIDSTLLILQHRLKAKHGCSAVEVFKHYGQLPLVECYAGQLNQVFMNILSNALDAIEERNSPRSTRKPQQPGQIHIYTEQSNGNQVRIRITDNGLGMTERVRLRLFDPFFTTKSVGKGTGLGLSISYQIVTKRHSGSLQCVSVPGQGAEFIIEIPIQQAKPLIED